MLDDFNLCAFIENQFTHPRTFKLSPRRFYYMVGTLEIFYFLCFGRHALQYTGLSGFGSKGTLSSLPQSAHVQGYIVLSSDMILCNFYLLSTVVLF